MKQKNYKILKLEKNRSSIIYNDLSRCIICGSSYNINKHEVFFGRNRNNSMKYGCIIPLCPEHHTGNNGIHFNNDMDSYFKKMFQDKWESIYGDRSEFIKVFGKNYLQ